MRSHARARYVFLIRNLLTKDFDNIDACVVYLSQRCRNLDDFQHDLMRMQYCMRLSALITVKEAKMEEEVNTWFNEVSGFGFRFWCF